MIAAWRREKRHIKKKQAQINRRENNLRIEEWAQRNARRETQLSSSFESQILNGRRKTNKTQEDTFWAVNSSWICASDFSELNFPPEPMRVFYKLNIKIPN